MTANPTQELKPARDQLDLIHGEWLRPAERLYATIDDPNTGVALQQQVATSAAEVDRAVAGAEAVFATEAWLTSLEARADLIRRVAKGIEPRLDEFAYEDALSTGNPIAVTRQLAGFLPARTLSAAAQVTALGESTILAAGGRSVSLERRPLGPAAILAPWNAPTFVAVAKVASALAAGCPVILKPSEWAPASSQILAEVIHESLIDLRMPAAMFQLVHGGAEVGQRLTSDPRIRAISFTGGGAGGRAVASAAAPHLTALQLELGGHNPAIIQPDADIELAAAAIADGMTKLNGQWCEAPGKVMVPADRHDAFVDALLNQLSTVKIGHCLAEETDLGPLAYSAHRQQLQGQIADAGSQGGQVLTSSSLPDLDGWFLAPTVITDLKAEQSLNELFGPIITVHSVATTQQAVAAASGPETGLAAFVFGTDLEAAGATASRILAGEIRINGCKLADLADGSAQTFWNGTGIGGHGPDDMVRFFQGNRTIGVDDQELPI